MLKFWGDILLMNTNMAATVAKKKIKKHAVRAIRFGAVRENAVNLPHVLAFFLIAPKRQIALIACFLLFFLATAAGMLVFINKMLPQNFSI